MLGATAKIKVPKVLFWAHRLPDSCQAIALRSNKKTVDNTIKPL